MNPFQQENSSIVTNAIRYARSNLDNPDISVETVADKAGFSTNYFNQVFAAHTGFSIMEYIRFERLRKAAQLLKTTGNDVLQIALEVGYESHEGFDRAFKRQYGISPVEYRKRERGKALIWGELSDCTLARRFLHDYPQFRLLDEEELIDSLMETDAKRFFYLCTAIQGMQLRAVTCFDLPQKGFLLIGDGSGLKGGYYLLLVSDQIEVVTDWLGHFGTYVQEVHTTLDLQEFLHDEKELQEKCHNVSHADIRKLLAGFRIKEEFMYFGEKLAVSLPQDIAIWQLSSKDSGQICKWAKDRTDGYAKHLMHLSQCEGDPLVLEYGVFHGDEMIAAVGCGIEEVRGLRLNNCINIMFANGKEQQELYKEIFSYVTNDILDRGVIPFDDIQMGGYAESHGGFQSSEMGYALVNRVWVNY